MNLRKVYAPYPLAGLAFSHELKQPLLQQVQQMLKIKGFYQESEQNSHRNDINDAILRFQQAEGLTLTGSLDPITYCHLYDVDITEISPRKDERNVNPTLAQGRIFINKAKRELILFNGKSPVRNYPVAIGKPSTPTPEGNYAIAAKIMHPGGMLGTRWMGLNFDPNYGIHGNNAPWSIGQLVSHGCVRMHNNHVEEVFNLVRIGTPVTIR